MRKERNLLGDDAMWTGIIPGLGFMNFILGWFTVPIEVFLRRDFGERYFTKVNFFAGLLILIVWNVLSVMIPFHLPWFIDRQDPDFNLLWFITRLYVYFSIMHFLVMWWNDIVGKPIHSFSAGKSWLWLIGWVAMKALGLILDPIAKFLIRILPGENKEEKIKSSVPVLQDANVFTERIIEPIFIFWCMDYAYGQGQNGMVTYLFFALMGHNLYTGMRHDAERSFVLDIRDRIIERGWFLAADEGRVAPGSGALKRIIHQTAAQAENYPEVMEILDEEAPPQFARAVMKVNPKLRNMVKKKEEMPGDNADEH